MKSKLVFFIVMTSSKAVQKKTWQSVEIFGLGNAIAELVKGTCLTTYGQVWRCVMYHSQADSEAQINKSRWEAGMQACCACAY